MNENAVDTRFIDECVSGKVSKGRTSHWIIIQRWLLARQQGNMWNMFEIKTQALNKQPDT
jgi:hypothetical protein